MSFCSRIRSGFSLPELLVVVGIIALLLALLVPGLSRATSVVRSTGCQANLRSIHGALQSYANDHNNYLPLYRAATGNNHYDGGTFWTNTLVGNDHAEAGDASIDGADPMSDPGIFFCPEGVDGRSAADGRAGTHVEGRRNGWWYTELLSDGEDLDAGHEGIAVPTWYQANGQENPDLRSLGDNAKVAPFAFAGSGDDAPHISMSAIPRVASVVLLVDGNGESEIVEAVNAERRIAARHPPFSDSDTEGNTNVLYLSGEVGGQSTAWMGRSDQGYADFESENVQSREGAIFNLRHAGLGE